MSKSNKERPTPDLVAAANILQALNPSRVGLLLVLYDNDTQTQKEISDLIGRTQSTISTYLQSLGSLSPPLATKQGKYYTITNTGEKVVGLINDMARRCELELRSINWTDDSDRKDVEVLLTPFSDSQTMRPFFILDSLYERSDVDGFIGSPQPVIFGDIVQDVEARQKEIGESVTTEQIRRTVKQRFDALDTAHFDEGKVTLTEKGHQQAWLWNELIQHLKTRTEGDAGRGNGSRGTEVESASETSDERSTLRSTPRGSSDQPRSPGSVSEQTMVEGALEDRQSADEEREILEEAHVVPVYTLYPNDEDADGDRKQTNPSLALPLTAKTTVEELVDRVGQLANDYEGDTELVLKWMVQAESEIYPLDSADSDSSNAQLHPRQ